MLCEPAIFRMFFSVIAYFARFYLKTLSFSKIFIANIWSFGFAFEQVTA